MLIGLIKKVAEIWLGKDQPVAGKQILLLRYKPDEVLKYKKQSRATLGVRV